VAIRDGRLVGIVSQVAPALPGPLVASDQVARQLSNQWPQGGSYEAQRRFVDGLVAIVQSSPDAATARARISDAVAASVKAGRIPPDAAESMVEGFSDASMRDVLTYRPVEVLSRLQGPALFVYGGKDIQVSSEQNAPVAREALKHNPQARVVVLEGLNHFLQRPRTADPEEWRALGGMMSDPQAMNLIVAWIEGVLAVRRGADTRASATARPAA
jgi:pimeloyl-ACP methyl ester carboxylesterase